MTFVGDQDMVRVLEIRREVFIGATPEISFEAVLEELGPGSELEDGTPFPMKLEPWPGGRLYRDLGEAGGQACGHLWAHVQVIKAPKLLELCGPLMMSFAAINHVQYRLTPEGSGTRLSLIHRGVGQIPQELREGMPEGWAHSLSRVRLIAEQRAAGA